jgi:two-component system response regulator YesN
MLKAKELLSTAGNQVRWVAGQVGIPNVSYFCAVFKKTFGQSPGEYQQNILL